MDIRLGRAVRHHAIRGAENRHHLAPFTALAPRSSRVMCRYQVGIEKEPFRPAVASNFLFSGTRWWSQTTYPVCRDRRGWSALPRPTWRRVVEHRCSVENAWAYRPPPLHVLEGRSHAKGPVQVKTSHAMSAPLEVAPGSDLGIHHALARPAAKPRGPISSPPCPDGAALLRKMRGLRVRPCRCCGLSEPSSVVQRSWRRLVVSERDHVEPSQTAAEFLLEGFREIGPPGAGWGHQP